jgi:hypothetical protein
MKEQEKLQTNQTLVWDPRLVVDQALKATVGRSWFFQWSLCSRMTFGRELTTGEPGSESRSQRFHHLRLSEDWFPKTTPKDSRFLRPLAFEVFGINQASKERSQMKPLSRLQARSDSLSFSSSSSSFGWKGARRANQTMVQRRKEREKNKFVNLTHWR